MPGRSEGGTLIRRKRLALGLTYQELARFLGVSSRTVRGWESGTGPGNPAFVAGEYDAWLHPLLGLFPRGRGMAAIPPELASRLARLFPLLRRPDCQALSQLKQLRDHTIIQIQGE